MIGDDMAVVNFSGLASGIDTSSLISAYLDQQRSTRVTPLQDKIDSLTETNSAFDKLSSLLAKFKSTVDKFRDLNGTVLSKQATSSSENRVSASASNGAMNGSYALNVISLAANANFSFGDRYASATNAINSSINDGAAAADRTVSVQVGTGDDQETVQVELTSSTTAADFVSQFNAASSKAEASLVNVGTSGAPSYAIVINSNNQGTAKGTIAVSVGSEITSAGSGAFATSQLSQAADASFTLSGISGVITKSSNTVGDLISGVTFQLNATGAATVTVADDATSTTSSMSEFVDAYNDIVEFLSENDAVTRDDSNETNIFGPLANTSLDENLISAIRSAFSSASTSGGTANTLSDLGITTQRDGTLKFDSNVFQSALANDPESVRSITKNLGETLAGVNGTIAQFSRFGGLIDVARQSNQSSIESSTKQIQDVERFLSQQEQTLQAQYARMESLIGKLNSQQAALSSLGAS